jgi:hypothetical protein
VKHKKATIVPKQRQAQALLCNFLVCRFLLLSSGDADDGYQWELQAFKC